MAIQRKPREHSLSGFAYAMAGLALVSGTAFIVISITGAQVPLFGVAVMFGTSVGILSSFILYRVMKSRDTITNTQVRYGLLVANALAISIGVILLLVALS